MEFEWDKTKSKVNFRKHGVSFKEAELAFDDEYGIERLDDWNIDDEIRYRLIAFRPFVYFLFPTQFAMKEFV